uniref:Uncharacterized protein n=1 Tax=Meloidogyne incognita TaxID=6306 RepID=A0A914LXP4_MELIC
MTFSLNNYPIQQRVETIFSLRADINHLRLQQHQRDDCSLESIGGPPTSGPPNGNAVHLAAVDVNELLAARAHLDQLEIKENVEAQLQRISFPH